VSLDSPTDGTLITSTTTIWTNRHYTFDCIPPEWQGITYIAQSAHEGIYGSLSLTSSTPVDVYVLVAFGQSDGGITTSAYVANGDLVELNGPVWLMEAQDGMDAGGPTNGYDHLKTATYKYTVGDGTSASINLVGRFVGALMWTARGAGPTSATQCSNTPSPTPPPELFCSLPATIDPNSKCVRDANEFSTLDADSDDDIPISLAISTKGETIDSASVTHPATAGSLSDDTATDGRYILACPQAAGLKTVKMTVTRPADITAFGGEWVQLFPKDSWANVTNEYEPFTFNEYGAKISVFRPPSTGLANDAPNEGTLNVFMEVSGEGDYEIMYGNPSLTSGTSGKWVSVQFKSTLLRVGAPWADCTGTALDTSSYEVGSIMPVLFGGPNLNSIALKDGFPSYDDVITELSGVTVPVKVVLEIFPSTGYTDSAVDGVCYKAGTACPEAHAVCEASYCEIDVWKAIIAGFKAASPGKVTVLGSVSPGTTSAAYAGLGVDGFYFVGSEVEGLTGTTVAAIGAPLFDETKVNDADVYLTLSGADLGLWSPFSWYPSVSPSKWAAIVTEAADTTATTDTIAALFDRGYGYVFLTSETGFETKSTITPAVLDAIEATSTVRRLTARNLQASEPFWGCDDTLFECKPICMKRMGVVTSKVSDTLCAGAPKDPCACKCYHAVQWGCNGEAIVCEAKFGAGELQTVGDKVCETRGAVKPASTAELRVATQCEPMTEMRGSAPTAQCLAKWESKAPAEVPAEVPSQATQAPVEQAPYLAESLATTFALAALALYA
jgi:hypothetical protein